MSDDTMKIVQVNLGDLKPHPRNVEIYGKELLDEGLAQSIREIGIDTPLEITEEKTIIKGHKRWICAKHLELATVPCRVRSDLKDDYSILYSLIEDNRHQRTRTPLQKQKETQTLIEIVTARRAAKGESNTGHMVEAGKIDLSKVEGMTSEEAQKLDEDIKEAQSKIKNPDKRTRSYHIGLKISGQPDKQYNQAKKVNDAIETLREKGRGDEADELVEIASRNLTAAEKKALVLTGKAKKEKPSKPKSQKSTINSQADNVLNALAELQKLLPNKDDMRLKTAVSVVNALKREFGEQP